jgi:hypothetical protein
MRKMVLSIYVLTGMVLLTVACSASPRALPPAPRERIVLEPTAPALDRGYRLFELAQRENGRLRWDQCLAERADKRARTMYQKQYFAHRDPETGRKPAWDLVASCYRCRSAAENLARGYDAPETVHQALMDSPTHRSNILNPEYSLLGIGCYRNICVELFAGF